VRDAPGLHVAVAIAALALLTGTARGQGLDAERFVPAVGAAGGLVVERAVVPSHLDYGLGLFLDFADDAVVLSDPDTDAILSRPVDSALTFDLLASIGLYDVVELGLHLPVHAIYDGDTTSVGGQELRAGGGLGDLRFVPKAVVWHTETLALGVAAPVTFPTGDETALRGAGDVTIEPRLLLGYRGKRLGVTGNAGLRLHTDSDDLDPVGHEVTLGAGVAYALFADRDRADLLAELVGAIDVSRGGEELTDVPLELLGGAAIKPWESVQVYVGAGVGLTDGLGTPDFRVLAGVRFAPRSTSSAGAYQDSDGDGIADIHDRCPQEAEDRDGFEDDDGCAEPDNDHDGIADDDDECPDDAEEPGGDRDGCPERGRVIVQGGKIVIIGKVQFETGSARIKSKSQPLLDDVAEALAQHPQIQHVEVQGHTDDVGSERVNQQLSQKRAEAVRDALVDRHVDPGRLEAHGYGESKPIAPNRTRAGRAKNRRVEFVVR